MGMTDKNHFPENTEETTVGWPEKPEHEEGVENGVSSQDRYPSELLEGIEAAERGDVAGVEDIIEDIDDNIDED